MTRWPLLMLMVLILSRALLVPATPVPAFQLLPQNFTLATPYPAASDSPSSGPRPGPRITLSLDVPVGLLQILLEQARARAVREQAAINSHILAHVGRR
ncbi:urocortin-2 [Talpa occidentalis]|uniref:urocortin-2 n=1 Tax=Talpa occidentalis TaxID=50954 RepID=UPI00188F5CB2|nr:urocortin-2 [Talpa occidentalis]